MENDQLVQVLQSLVSSDNDARAHAETVLNSEFVEKHPDLLLRSLMQILRQNSNEALRSFSAILFRRIALKLVAVEGSKEPTSLFFQVNQETRDVCMAELLNALSTETAQGVRKKICDCIAEVAKAIFNKGQTWPQLLPAIYQCIQSPEAHFRESAYLILISAPRLIMQSGAVDVASVAQVFSQSLSSNEQIDVRIAALAAAVNFLLEVQLQKKAMFADLMVQMLNVLPPLLESMDEAHLVDAFASLIDLAMVLPRLFRPILPQLLMFVMQILGHADLEDTTKQTALELLLTISDEAPAMIRKQTPDFCAQVIPVCLNMMADLEDDARWHNAEDLDEEDDESENSVIGEQSMDRIARNIGGKSVVPIAFHLIPQMLGSSDWQQRHAALMAVSAIGEGCHKMMAAELPRVLDMVLPFVRDPHPRVRYASCNCIGQMATDFEPELQTKFHQRVFAELLPAMDDAQSPRVQAHAAAALVNFCEHISKEHVEPFLDAIFSRLVKLAGMGRIYVQEQAITTMATVADAASDKFVKYYPQVMPSLFAILRQADAKEFRLLRGKAMECASLIAMAVGKEVIQQDAHEFLNLLMEIQKVATDPDDPQVSYLLHAWARMCQVMGTDFLPYLSVVMPPLLHSAALKPDVAMLDLEEDLEDYPTEEGWEFTTIDGQRMGIKTTTLDEKCTAVEMLICYARSLGAGFHEYAEQVLDLVVPLLKFYFHDGVRQAAIVCIPQVLNSVVKQGYPQEKIQAMWDKAFQKMFGALPDEMDVEFIYHIYNSFVECVKTLGASYLPPQHLEFFIRTTDATLQEFYERLKERDAKREDDDHDPEQEENIEEEAAMEDTVISEINKAFQALLMVFGPAFLPYFEQILPTAASYMADQRFEAYQFGICLFDDVVEYTGPASWKYHQFFVERMIQATVHDNPELRQSAAYGVGICARFGGPDFADACAAAIPNLFRAVQGPDARSEDNVMATENAIAAIGKICRYNATKLDVNQVLPAWVALLPVVHDDEEAPEVYSFLMELIRSHHPACANPSQWLPILADALLAGLLDTEKSAQVVQLLRDFLSGLGEKERAQLLSVLGADRQRSLQEQGYF
ncbi:importin subunit beta-3 [Sorochytrium milnesiophthora]